MQKHQATTKDDVKVAGYLTIKTFKDGELVRTAGPFPNKVVAGSGGYGRNIIARQLSGDATYSLTIDEAQVGDSNTAAADSDTALGNALVTGETITNFTVNNDELQVDVFITDANMPDDVYEEFGLLCNSRLFTRIIISPAYTKATGEDTLFTYTLTLAG